MNAPDPPVPQGLFLLSQEWHRMRYRAMKAESQLAELRGILHAHFSHGSEIALGLLRLEAGVCHDARTAPVHADRP